MTTIGKLDKRIVIEQRTVTQDPLGGEIVTWVPLFGVWCQVMYGSGLRSAEAIQQNGVTAMSTASFRILNRKGLLARQRVLYNSQIWDIVDIRHDTARKFTDLVCTQGLNDG